MKYSPSSSSPLLLTVLWLWLGRTWPVAGGPGFYTEYASNAMLADHLAELAAKYSNLAKLYSIGKSSKGTELYVMAIGRKVSDDLLRPRIKYIGGIHGNEVVGTQVLLALTDFLLTRYGLDDKVTSILDNSSLHVLYRMNPDGFDVALRAFRSGEKMCDDIIGRGNADLQDLNRDFPDPFQPGGASRQRQPETRALIDWITNTQFALSASFHGGALVVNYPYDGNRNGTLIKQPSYNRSPDDDVFRDLALTYSWNNKAIRGGVNCSNDVFTFGVTNGAAWYPVFGGMQDFSYVYAGAMELTIELGCCKMPLESQLPKLWHENREALLKLLERAQTGVYGIVRNTNGSPVRDARLVVVGREQHHTSSTSKGEYWRLLLPGRYTLKVSHPSFVPFTKSFRLPMRRSRLRLDVTLTPSQVINNFASSSQTSMLAVLLVVIITSI